MSQFSDHRQVAEFGFVSVNLLIAMYDMIKIKKVKLIMKVIKIKASL